MGDGPTRPAFVPALAAAPLPTAPTVSTQQRLRLPVTGVLWHAGSAEEEPYRTPLIEGFAGLGYVAGRTVIFDERYAGEVPERFERNAWEPAAAGPDVIVAVSIPSVLAAQRAARRSATAPPPLDGH